jgi:hypothetical protein
VLADDLIKWTAMLGEITNEGQLVVARTVRNSVLSVPGRLVSCFGRRTLRLPVNWPWGHADVLLVIHAMPRVYRRRD